MHANEPTTWLILHILAPRQQHPMGHALGPKPGDFRQETLAFFCALSDLSTELKPSELSTAAFRAAAFRELCLLGVSNFADARATTGGDHLDCEVFVFCRCDFGLGVGVRSTLAIFDGVRCTCGTVSTTGQEDGNSLGRGILSLPQTGDPLSETGFSLVILWSVARFSHRPRK